MYVSELFGIAAKTSRKIENRFPLTSMDVHTYIKINQKNSKILIININEEKIIN